MVNHASDNPVEVAQHPHQTQFFDFHFCETQRLTRSLYFQRQKQSLFCILHYRLNLELLTTTTKSLPVFLGSVLTSGFYTCVRCRKALRLR
jgi:hypothetical protein